MRTALALTAAALLASPAALTAQDDTYVAPPEELTQARQIIEAMFPMEQRDQMILDLAVTVGKQAASGTMSGPLFEEPGIKAIIDQFLADLPETMRPLFAKHMPQVFEATAVAYTRQFTLEELQDISAFSRTPSGRRYFMTLTQLQGDPGVAAANQELFTNLVPIQQAQGLKVRKQVEEYLLANPEVIERLQKAGVGKGN